MNSRNRKTYTRQLGVGSLLGILVIGAIVAAIGCGFVHLRTLRVTDGDRKRVIEREIVSLEKQIATLELRVAEAVEREALMMRLRLEGTDLVQIENHFRTLQGVPIERVAMRAPDTAALRH